MDYSFAKFNLEIKSKEINENNLKIFEQDFFKDIFFENLKAKQIGFDDLEQVDLDDKIFSQKTDNKFKSIVLNEVKEEQNLVIIHFSVVPTGEELIISNMQKNYRFNSKYGLKESVVLIIDKKLNGTINGKSYFAYLTRLNGNGAKTVIEKYFEKMLPSYSFLFHSYLDSDEEKIIKESFKAKKLICKLDPFKDLNFESEFVEDILRTDTIKLKSETPFDETIGKILNDVYGKIHLNYRVEGKLKGQKMKFNIINDGYNVNTYYYPLAITGNKDAITIEKFLFDEAIKMRRKFGFNYE